MTEVSEALKRHPDYSDGHFDGLNDRESDGTSEAYALGYKNGQWARELFESKGFTQIGDSEFSVSGIVRGQP